MNSSANMDLRDMKGNIFAKAKCLDGNFYPPAKAGGNSTRIKFMIGKAHSNATEAKSMTRSAVSTHSTMNRNEIQINYTMNRNVALAHSYKTKVPLGFSQNNLLNLPIIIGIKVAMK